MSDPLIPSKARELLCELGGLEDWELDSCFNARLRWGEEKDPELGSWINDFHEQKPWCFLRVYPQHFQANPKGPKGPIVSGRFRKHLYKFIIIYRGTCGLPLFFQPASWKRSSMVLAHLLRREVGSSVSQYLDMCPTWVKWILCSSKLPKTSSLHWPEIWTHTHSIGGESRIGTFLIPRIFADFAWPFYGTWSILRQTHFFSRKFNFPKPGVPPKNHSWYIFVDPKHPLYVHFPMFLFHQFVVFPNSSCGCNPRLPPSMAVKMAQGP